MHDVHLLKTHQPQQDACGFSLVELSIVLVILGLLTGGILSGQALIRAAELRNVTGSVDKVRMAYFAFYDSYLAYPGDIGNATAFWPAAASCPNGGSSAETCDGNGDGQVMAATEDEIYRAWQHLVMAGLWEGTYTGRHGGGVAAKVGINIPPLKRSNVGLLVEYLTAGGGGINTIARPSSGHYLIIGSERAGGVLENAALSATEAYFMDTKIDDGAPHKGLMIAHGKNNWNPDCVIPSNDAYNLAMGDSLSTGSRNPGCQVKVQFD